MTNLHCCENEKLNDADWFVKVCPFYNINERLQKFSPHIENHPLGMDTNFESVQQTRSMLPGWNHIKVRKVLDHLLFKNIQTFFCHLAISHIMYSLITISQQCLCSRSLRNKD
ncbi:hypothetical protein PR048_017917 [Dryococelus australis]|uniref:Uncharacterized protein n=1 Tax=Dryococelus australis TaxID=614101 RepID=A0ABQ9HB64_9NEOP|nr:hypothetical protein PR048_017917 [Dryococelus australis]